MSFPKKFRTRLSSTFVGMLVCGGSVFCLSGNALAQSVSPMEKETQTFTDKFVVQVEIANNYPTAEISEIYLRSAEWGAVKGAVLSSRRVRLASGKKMTITALIPFEHDKKYRHVYLCHAITPGSGTQGAAYRGEVCGKYSAKRVG